MKKRSTPVCACLALPSNHSTCVLMCFCLEERFQSIRFPLLLRISHNHNHTHNYYHNQKCIHSVPHLFPSISRSPLHKSISSNKHTINYSNVYISWEDYIISSLTLSSLFMDSTRCSPSLSSRFSSIAFSKNSMPSREYLPLISGPFSHKICRIEFSTSVKCRFTWIPFVLTPRRALPAANPRYSAVCCSKTRVPPPKASPTSHFASTTHSIIVQLVQLLQLLLQIVTLTLQPATLLS